MKSSTIVHNWRASHVNICWKGVLGRILKHPQQDLTPSAAHRPSWCPTKLGQGTPHLDLAAHAWLWTLTQAWVHHPPVAASFTATLPVQLRPVVAHSCWGTFPARSPWWAKSTWKGSREARGNASLYSGPYHSENKRKKITSIWGVSKFSLCFYHEDFLWCLWFTPQTALAICSGFHVNQETMKHWNLSG